MEQSVVDVRLVSGMPEQKGSGSAQIQRTILLMDVLSCSGRIVF
jgi:hypothetical protein